MKNINFLRGINLEKKKAEDVISYLDVKEALKANYKTAPKILEVLGFKEDKEIVETYTYQGSEQRTKTVVCRVLCLSDFIRKSFEFINKLQTAVYRVQKLPCNQNKQTKVLKSICQKIYEQTEATRKFVICVDDNFSKRINRENYKAYGNYERTVTPTFFLESSDKAWKELTPSQKRLWLNYEDFRNDLVEYLMCNFNYSSKVEHLNFYETAENMENEWDNVLVIRKGDNFGDDFQSFHEWLDNGKG